MIDRLALALAAALLLGCGTQEAIDATKGVPKKLDKTNDQIKETKRLTKLGLGLEGIFREENTVIIDPVPVGMMPSGKLIAEEATPEELLGILDLWLFEVDNGNLDVPPEGESETYKVANNRHKRVKYTAVTIVAGLAPQKKVEEIVRTQVQSGGEYEELVYKCLMARAIFIHDILLRSKYLKSHKSVYNAGTMEKAVNALLDLEYLMALPFKEKISLSTTGFDGDLQPNLDVRLDFDLKILWKRLQKAMDQNLTPSSLSDPKQRKKIERLKKKAAPFLE